MIRRWHTWGVCRKGPLHEELGLPNQDFWLGLRYKWGEFLAVSDGVGSRPHADIGSKAACFASAEAAMFWHRHPELSPADIVHELHNAWLRNISPLSPHDCSATCLFAIRAHGSILLGRLGDGMVVSLGTSPEKDILLEENKGDDFANMTHGLREDFQPEAWQTALFSESETRAILLCTDGISDELRPELRTAFARSFCLTYSKLPAPRRRRLLRRCLHRWPVKGHLDDQTAACLFKGDLS